jgi:transposase-like protein
VRDPTAERKRLPRNLSRAQKKAILQEVIDSGLTIPVWAERNEYNSGTLYQWFNELKMPKPVSASGHAARINGGRALPPDQANRQRAAIARTLAERRPPAPPAPAPAPPARAPGLTVRLGDTELSFGEAPSPEYLAKLAKALKA